MWVLWVGIFVYFAVDNLSNNSARREGGGSCFGGRCAWKNVVGHKTVPNATQAPWGGGAGCSRAHVGWVGCEKGCPSLGFDIDGPWHGAHSKRTVGPTSHGSLEVSQYEK